MKKSIQLTGMHIERYSRAIVNFRILIAVFLLAALLFVGGASATTVNGTCGENLTWTLDTDTGVLEIAGTGEMTDYSAITDIGWYNYRDTITSVSIGSGVTSIEQIAFSGCTSLTSVIIPDSVTSIGAWAFYHCTSLTSVVIPGSVTSIEVMAFSGCTSLTSVVIPDSVTSIEDSAFSGCTSLTSIVIPDSVTSIEDGAFSGCTSLTSVVIPDSVTSIGEYAFDDCYNLQVVDLSDTTALSSVGQFAFGSTQSSGLKSGSVIYVSDERTAALFIDGTNYYAPNTRIIVGKPAPETPVQEIPYSLVIGIIAAVFLIIGIVWIVKNGNNRDDL
ncbi:hypothetical protein SDC9_17370 [bioreactor metagenome]|uniref:Leucine-rich repeat domain-containing protein n=1 Tax=bioreactor metagenome TaxID=1076179 RepID=A0A644TXA0_9ZZZZ|nr:leucine-rich repeat domain-containing protein [Methanocorpusculum sp.]